MTLRPIPGRLKIELPEFGWPKIGLPERINHLAAPSLGFSIRQVIDYSALVKIDAGESKLDFPRESGTCHAAALTVSAKLRTPPPLRYFSASGRNIRTSASRDAKLCLLAVSCARRSAGIPRRYRPALSKETRHA